MNKFCVYLTTYTGDKLPQFYVGSSSIGKVAEGYRTPVASQKYRAVWKQELRDSPEAFSTEILSTHATRIEAVEAELRWQLNHRVVESSNFINMAYASAKFYGLSTPDLIEAFRNSIASRTLEEQVRIRVMCQDRQRKMLAARTPEKVRETAEKQAVSLSLNHASKTSEEKALIANKKRQTLSSHDQNWHDEVNARRAFSQRTRHATRRGKNDD